MHHTRTHTVQPTSTLSSADDGCGSGDGVADGGAGDAPGDRVGVSSCDGNGVTSGDRVTDGVTSWLGVGVSS